MRDYFPSPAVGLDDLLAGVARGLMRAQGELDACARSTSDVTATSSDGDVHLRPLWFVFERTTLELEFSTFVASSASDGAQFQCRPLDPVALAIRGDARALGARLRVEIAPLGAGLLRDEESTP